MYTVYFYPLISPTSTKMNLLNNAHIYISKFSTTVLKIFTNYRALKSKVTRQFSTTYWTKLLTHTQRYVKKKKSSEYLNTAKCLTVDCKLKTCEHIISERRFSAPAVDVATLARNVVVVVVARSRFESASVAYNSARRLRSVIRCIRVDAKVVPHVECISRDNYVTNVP